MVERIGESGDPWGIPMPATGTGWHTCPSTRTETWRSERKDLSQATSSGGKPKSSIVWTRRAWLTWSK
ncbi:hypothetical protein EV121DRAFT_218019 [Schizophyllum commune]